MGVILLLCLLVPQFEAENAALRETNKLQEAQILDLQKQLQGGTLHAFLSDPSAGILFP